MAHTKAGGSTKLGRDSQGQRLGTKVSDGQRVHQGSVLVRQRGTKYRPGENARKGSDDTLFATATGLVRYQQRKVSAFTGARKRRTIISVEPAKT